MGGQGEKVLPKAISIPWGCIHRGPTKTPSIPPVCKQIWSLKRRREETEPVS